MHEKMCSDLSYNLFKGTGFVASSLCIQYRGSENPVLEKLLVCIVYAIMFLDVYRVNLLVLCFFQKSPRMSNQLLSFWVI